VQAAEREPAEKLNLHRTPGRLLVVGWALRAAEGDKLLFGKALEALDLEEFANACQGKMIEATADLLCYVERASAFHASSS